MASLLFQLYVALLLLLDGPFVLSLFHILWVSSSSSLDPHDHRLLGEIRQMLEIRLLLIISRITCLRLSTQDNQGENRSTESNNDSSFLVRFIVSAVHAVHAAMVVISFSAGSVWERSTLRGLFAVDGDDSSLSGAAASSSWWATVCLGLTLANPAIFWFGMSITNNKKNAFSFPSLHNAVSAVFAPLRAPVTSGLRRPSTKNRTSDAARQGDDGSSTTIAPEVSRTSEEEEEEATAAEDALPVPDGLSSELSVHLAQFCAAPPPAAAAPATPLSAGRIHNRRHQQSSSPQSSPLKSAINLASELALQDDEDADWE